MLYEAINQTPYFDSSNPDLVDVYSAVLIRRNDTDPYRYVIVVSKGLSARLWRDQIASDIDMYINGADAEFLYSEGRGWTT